ncbi:MULTISPECIES: SRPBCC domain-containing protein [unclassified Bradyrhizobium]|uniref:SRPBCC family protein n=1 Tax=unclassified Bradyrhizobium TaxID=2631580 RepID=UPI001BA7E8D8|nr:MULTISPECIES: SRPBCC domain-containing protein [unclassified Bradyrhizobium]MBR1204149.1 SRPBCC domain-containing protein [Bradyrhizobium sp. AUGA SZCCT0124]MBR1309965.1 SRPBCC domain-containing protein [Bradyrhizobium sp. AUGA SZCCT0051]MBR1340106.1 SRPBCC domain-containing protein [Bradyrhizobium sp. AUGA SZCCT0105]MBR1354713.1 SRPBCC domain-containing protein [Bradyrhizobium sp. AUGA SZCCT0045]
MGETHAITVEKVLPYAADRIWRTLTTSELLMKWLMPNDFHPSVGHKFTFRTKPIGDWDGVVHCEVLDCDPPRLLRYSWKGGADTNPEFGSKLDSVVTWTLTPVEGGTQVRMVHDGFVFPGNRYAFDMMSPGWGKIVDAIGRVTAEA